jgi:hypothetical protein
VVLLKAIRNRKRGRRGTKRDPGVTRGGWTAENEAGEGRQRARVGGKERETWGRGERRDPEKIGFFPKKETFNTLYQNSNPSFVDHIFSIRTPFWVYFMSTNSYRRALQLS